MGSGSIASQRISEIVLTFDIVQSGSFYSADIVKPTSNIEQMKKINIKMISKIPSCVHEVDGGQAKFQDFFGYILIGKGISHCAGLTI